MITDPRTIMAGVALIAATPAFAQTPAPAPRPMPAMNPADVKMAPQFYAAVLPRAEMSLSTSHLGVEKTTNRKRSVRAALRLW